MNRFKLRLPTIEDWEAVCRSISADDRLNALHCDMHPFDYTFKHNFHLADTNPDNPNRHALAQRLPGRPDAYFYGATDNSNSCFRPVLETDEDMSCIKDGTIIQMGFFITGLQPIPIPEKDEAPFPWPVSNKFGGPTLGLMPIEPKSDSEKISWIKCGNILMADRNLIGNISLSRLKEMGLVDGVSLQMPFDEAASKYFYEVLRKQPDSPQRHIGEIMVSLERELEGYDLPGLLTRDELYHISLSIHAGWCHTESLSLDDAILYTSIVLSEGIDDFTWCRKAGVFESADFSAKVLQYVLKRCDQDVFDHLVFSREELSYEYFATNDENGNLTVKGKALCLLEEAYQKLETIKQKGQFLDDMLSDAKSRTPAAAHSRTGVPQKEF